MAQSSPSQTYDDRASGASPLFLRDEELRVGFELLYFAYRDFAKASDSLLGEAGLGRAHQRALYFVARKPGLSVSDLIGILQITKQSLSRVVADLTEKGLIEQKPDPLDRRRKLLTLTERGAELHLGIEKVMRDKMADAYRAAGAEAVAGFRKVLTGLINRRPLDEA